MDAASWIIVVMVGIAVVLGLGVYLWAHLQQRRVEQEAEQQARAQLAIGAEWEQAVARHRATTVGSLPPVPSKVDQDPDRTG